MQSSKLIELHVALIGMTSAGKSALAVKYITRRFIGEYHAELEDTYCRQDTILNHPVMVWLMDTVESSHDIKKDAMRYLAWADVYVVVYDVTSQLSLQYAEKLLHQITQHEHSLCMRSHKTLLVGNKCDLERYRQVRESDGERLAKRFGALFAETSAVEDYQRVAAVIHRPLNQIITERTTRRSPSPRLYNSDSEVQTQRNKGFSVSLKNVTRSGTLRRSKSPKSLEPQHKFSIGTKSKAGSKLLKLFHN
ncbi:hypothetical protein QR680_009656 [Steinernema hermaphroditum]|uniref:small monomeric GTPase n=1 Tax=Steinernema hermaphroditum TaxID=289476 RepID=A0AA39IN56_9BILA|nr:hypothetical protein QR680_009656 [Steinernema hermaphroditum]